MTAPRFVAAEECAALLGRLRAVVEAQGYLRERPDAVREVVGVANHRLPGLARAWHEAHPDTAPADLWALATSLWHAPVHEAPLLAGRLLARHPAAVRDLAWAEVRSWRAGVDSVEGGDAYAVRVLGPWTLHDVPGRIATVRGLLEGDLLDRRLALLTTVWLNRGQPGVTHPEATVEFADAVIGDREPLVLHAQSWALRALARGHRELVAAYLASRPGLDEVVRGEVRNWLVTGSLRGDTVHAWRIPGALRPE